MKDSAKDYSEKARETSKGHPEKHKAPDRQTTALQQLLTEDPDPGKETKVSEKVKPSKEENADGTTESMDGDLKYYMQLAEEAVENMVHSYNRQLETNAGLSNKLTQVLKESALDNPQHAWTLISDNLETCSRLAFENTTRVLNLFHKQSELAADLSKNFDIAFGEMIQTFREVQQNNFSMLSEWASEWWKQPESIEK
jgi:hypothetical protein